MAKTIGNFTYTEFTIPMGSTVTDIVTGFSGVVTGQSRYMTGCNQYCVNPRKLKDDGNPGDAQWFDEHRLVISGKPALNVTPRVTEGISGGPCLEGRPNSRNQG